MIESIEMLSNDSVLVITDDQDTAKQLLKKNPRAQVQQSEDERFGLVYSLSEINLMNAIKRPK